MHPTRTTWAVVLSAALASTPTWAEEAPKEAIEAPGPAPTPAPAPAPAPRTGWGVQGLPLVNFNSDEGFGYGSRLMVVDSGDGTQRPYRLAFVAQFFQTTNGVGMHRLIVDAPGFLSSPWRLGVDVSLLNDRFSPYYGLGSAAGYEPAFATCEDR